jgi:oligopeptide/dipeptide ABC transporter ATP-binding protein
VVAGQSVARLGAAGEKQLRRTVQVIFQDPYDSLNPRMRVGDILAEPLGIHGLARTAAEREQRVGAMLARVGLSPPERYVDRFPAELSGGQRQRIAIARAMIVNPRVVVADEPLSMLDASVKAGIMALLADFKRDGVTIFVITHDLSITRYLCDRIAVMYLGDLVEVGPASAVVDRPWHPYTELLIASVPEPDRPRQRRLLTDGEPPSAARRPPGCPFHPRCGYATDRCRSEAPAELVDGPRRSACWHADRLRAGGG